MLELLLKLLNGFVIHVKMQVFNIFVCIFHQNYNRHIGGMKERFPFSILQVRDTTRKYKANCSQFGKKENCLHLKPYLQQHSACNRT